MTEKRKITKPKEMERIPVKFYSHKYILENEVTVNPMGEIAGFQMRPGGFVVPEICMAVFIGKTF